VAQWAKRPPLKQEVPRSSPRGWFKRSRWESRPLSLVGNGAGAGTHPIDRVGSVFPRGTGRFLVKKGVHIASFRCLSDETLRSYIQFGYSLYLFLHK
jgi:hypothetical protein